MTQLAKIRLEAQIIIRTYARLKKPMVAKNRGASPILMMIDAAVYNPTLGSVVFSRIMIRTAPTMRTVVQCLFRKEITISINQSWLTKSENCEENPTRFTAKSMADDEENSQKQERYIESDLNSCNDSTICKTHFSVQMIVLRFKEDMDGIEKKQLLILGPKHSITE